MEENRPSQVIQSVVQRVAEGVSRVVYGHEQVVSLLAGAFVVGGHVLLEGPPGVAKTLLAKTFAGCAGLSFKRIQFTPDLMPSDVTGVYVFDQQSGSFRFSAGPVFASIVLADEINRAVPKTQSALLEAMEEHFVTIDGTRHTLDELFFLVATQNPIEHEGTFPLPEAQLDRFLFKLTMGYPGAQNEAAMIARFSSEVPDYRQNAENQAAETVVSREELLSARAALRRMQLESSITAYIQQLAEATRRHADLILGASPRAALHLALAAKLHAAFDQRDYVIPDDVKAAAPYVLPHRLVFQPEVYETEGRAARLIAEIVDQIPVPDRPMT